MIIRCIRCRKEDRGFDFTMAIQPSVSFDLCDTCVKKILRDVPVMALITDEEIVEKEMENMRREP